MCLQREARKGAASLASHFTKGGERGKDFVSFPSHKGGQERKNFISFLIYKVGQDGKNFVSFSIYEGEQ